VYGEISYDISISPYNKIAEHAAETMHSEYRISNVPDQAKATILHLLISDPIYTSVQIVAVDENKRQSARKWPHNEGGQPYWTFGIRVAECTVRSVVMAIRQFALIALQSTHINTKDSMKVTG